MRKGLPEQGLGWLVVRFLGARWSRSVLTALGVALGVGLLTAVTALGATLRDTLAERSRASYGAYDFAAWYPDRPMDAEEQQTWQQRVPDVRYAVPILVDGPYVGIGAYPKRVRGYSLEAGRYPGPGEFAARRSVAEGLGVRLGESATLSIGGRSVPVKLVGVRAPGAPGPLEPPDALFFDLNWLQEQTGKAGQATLQLYGATTDRLLGYANLEAVQPGIQIFLNAPAGNRTLEALQVYANVFGVIALLAGLYLTASFFYTSVFERMRDLSILRAVGAVPQQTERMVLQEAAVLGLLGGVAGLGLGLGAAGALLGAAAAGVGLAATPHMVLPWLPLLGETALGVVVAVVAARRPAKTAGALRPLQAMRPSVETEGEAGSSRGLWAAALGLLLMPVALLLESGSGLRALCGLVSGLLVIAGIISIQPWLLPWVADRLATRWADRLPGEVLLALRFLQRHRRRTAMTVTTILLGVALVTGVGTLFSTVMTESARYAESRFPFDASVYPEGHLESRHLGTELYRQIVLTEGVTRVQTVGSRLSGRSNYGNLSVTPVDLAAYSQVYDFGKIEGSLTGGAVISRDLAAQMALKVGDKLRFTSFDESHRAKDEKRDEVPLVVAVVGVVERWPWTFGVRVAVPPSLLPGQPDGVIFFDYNPALRDSVLKRVRQLLADPRYGTAVLEDRSESLAENRRIGQQVWSLFAAVAGIVFLIAAMGLWGTIVAGLQARRRELAVVRAVGSTPAQTRRQVVLEALLMGCAGALLGVACGAAFAAGLFAGLDGPIYAQALWFFLGCLVGGPVLAVAAALGPARTVGRGTVAGALRVE
ncbi:MAG TPA: ABC transporter permease [Symbiobacteriaceae bacterium]|nr:ABC transporter permease [Symbiobacteriaceae bacterium]